jgi:hypothetical protein
MTVNSNKTNNNNSSLIYEEFSTFRRSIALLNKNLHELISVLKDKKTRERERD